MPTLQVKRLIPDNDPEGDTRVYFSRAELTSERTVGMRGDPALSEDPVLSLALEIPGVALAALTPYSIAISRAPTYSWAEIESHILRLLTSLNLGEGALESKLEEK
jgi:hypothetical protein